MSTATTEAPAVPRLKERYLSETAPALRDEQLQRAPVLEVAAAVVRQDEPRVVAVPALATQHQAAGDLQLSR